MGFGSKRGGTKVPNAKLKPVPIPSAPRSDLNSVAHRSTKPSKGKGKETCNTPLAIEGDDDEEDQSEFRESLCREKSLLAGCIVCFSGILDPVKAAIDNNIKIMLPMWLEALYSSFTEGDNVDFKNITQRYAMKPFQSLKFSITGSTSTPRTHFIQLAEDNGASVSLNLDIDCTHLIVLASSEASADVDSTLFNLDKVQAARKTDASIKIVWQEWLEDSAARGGCLSETLYLMKEGLPRPSRLHLNHGTNLASKGDSEKPALTREFCSEEPAVAIKRAATRPGSQTAILASIISEQDLPATRAFNRVKSRPSRAASPDVGPDPPEFDFGDLHRKEDATSNSQVVNAASRLTDLLDQPKSIDRQSLVKKLSSVRSSKFESTSHTSSQRVEDARGQTAWAHPTLFRNCTISIAGCTPSHHRQVTEAVTDCGAIVTSDHAQADYTIVPHIKSAPLNQPFCLCHTAKCPLIFVLSSPPWIPPGCNPVAHSWVEQSLFEGQLVDPDNNWAARPIRLNPIPSPEQHVFSACGYNPPELQILKRAVNSLKLKFIDYPHRHDVTHIFVGPDKNSARLQKVKSWSEKEFVDLDWLLTLARGERITSASSIVIPAMSAVLPSALERQSQVPLPLQLPQPLIDCVIYVTRKASVDRHSKSVGACRKLGARVVERFDETVTHLIHIGERSNEASKEFKVAKAKGMFIVHPCWLTECKNKTIRAEEIAFPHTYKAGLALDYATSPVPERSTRYPLSSQKCADNLPSSSTGHDLESDLQEDEDFFQLNDDLRLRSPVLDPSRTINGLSSESEHLAEHQSVNNDYVLKSGVEAESEDFENQLDPDKFFHGINVTATSHLCELPPSSSPLQPAEPGFNTQIGGFLELLQKRNATPDAMKNEKENRRTRKRGLVDHSRSNSTGPSANVSLSGRLQKSQVGSDTGLHRTLSDLALANRALSKAQPEFEEYDESMKVTWDDPISKRNIITARVNKKTTDRRIEQRPEATNTGRGSGISDVQEQENSLHGQRAVIIDLATDTDQSQNQAVPLPPLKRRRARLIS
ncbi:uncharacterized protein MELLADRAFT_78268 [Melampsora larici-populina 98AG31]|uniref:BRCT domain-containing protein n=1 Tax=Melampsora larici-populina (strain 98AG31 / pathotype 3-4-7) TaxID=747676 RepID=F4RSB3_MELLP|nr:uncharacterized protein MELLADRAFT_78268 [Melampsora larici-populina 98AG31]EGG04720.1 hypothetical protein MELLADRAFT_78268 [Melampsora larici-populina 98AG31]